MIGCIRKVNNLKFLPRNVSCRNYKHYNPAQFVSDHKQLNLSTDSTDVNMVWFTRKKLFFSVVEKHIPVIIKKICGKKTPWY